MNVATLAHRELACFLGPRCAETALAVLAHRALGKPPELLTGDDIPRLCQAMRPMLRAFIGAQGTEAVLAKLSAHASL